MKHVVRSLPDDVSTKVLAILLKAREPMRMGELRDAAGLTQYRLKLALESLGKQVACTGTTLSRRVGLAGKSPKEVP